MKRAVVVLAVLFALGGLAGSARAVTLEQGWYAEFDYVWVKLTGTYAEPWYPTSTTGQFGALLVTEGLRPTSRGRKITVTETTHFPTGVIFEDWGNYAGAYPYYDVVEGDWLTDYDASKLRLGLYRRRPGSPTDVLLWQQPLSGYQAGGGDLSYYGVQQGDSVGFKLVVLPEPSGLLGLAAGALFVVVSARRRWHESRDAGRML
jgi:hypothetical protein